MLCETFRVGADFSLCLAPASFSLHVEPGGSGEAFLVGEGKNRITRLELWRACSAVDRPASPVFLGEVPTVWQQVPLSAEIGVAEIWGCVVRIPKSVPMVLPHSARHQRTDCWDPDLFENRHFILGRSDRSELVVDGVVLVDAVGRVVKPDVYNSPSGSARYEKCAVLSGLPGLVCESLKRVREGRC